jgi:hypothetical protein
MARIADSYLLHSVGTVVRPEIGGRFFPIGRRYPVEPKERGNRNGKVPDSREEAGLAQAASQAAAEAEAEASPPLTVS